MIFIGRWLKGKFAFLISALPLFLFLYFLSFTGEISRGASVLFPYTWVSQAGISLNFYLDGISLLFALMITGIGSLLFLYTASYLKGHVYLDRFYAYLCMFMASMLGLVLSDNIITLFIFWELTSISSFFLIGFNNTDKASRRSALTALTITGGGGFLLLCGVVLMHFISGTFSISEMQGLSGVIQAHPLYLLVVLFILGGAFTKSAQFPLHFWLPAAMKAPTPVSTYLHSATMVKAGVYLVARMTPVLGDHIYWNGIIMAVGGVTMLYGAVHSVFRKDLKAILAFSTVSALGLLMFLLGMGTEAALTAAFVFILVHALYKATLFLVTGIVDHETGTRDITKLGGLRKVIWPVALAGLLAALSGAGIPLTFGFVGKELIYEATVGRDLLSYLVTGGTILANIFLFAAAFLAGINPFRGQLRPALQHVHLPHIFLWLPPLLLGVAGLWFGLLPSIPGGALVNAAVSAGHPGAAPVSLAAWHGFNNILLLSGITLAGGGLLYAVLRPLPEGYTPSPLVERLTPERLFFSLGALIRRISRWCTIVLQNGYLRIYVLYIILFVVMILCYSLIRGVNIAMNFEELSEISSYELLTVLVMFASIVYTVVSKSRILAIAALGVIGYCICLLFVFYSAPDVAMTQFIIDNLTVVLFVLVLYRLPPYIALGNRLSRTRDVVVSVIFGALISVIALGVLSEPSNRETSMFFAENAYTQAKGKNIVNVILVDFRGTDTLVEISVLTIAAIGVFSLLKLQGPKLNED